MLPSIKRGALFIIRYFVEAGVKAKDLPDLTLTHRVNIFPAFHSGMPSPRLETIAHLFGDLV